MKEQEKALIILSGGLDSTTTMALAQEAGYCLYTITFDYEQRHGREIEAAKAVAAYYEAPHHVIKLGHIFAENALSKARPTEGRGEQKTYSLEQKGDEIPDTYVPARNILFLALALSYAEKIKARALYMGVNALDHPGYPDCRPPFIEAFQQVIDQGTERGVLGEGVRLETPLLYLKKEEILQIALRLDCPLHLTHTCYAGESPACGVCASCINRRQAFHNLGLQDPIPYQ
ncbi:7-cyano-7-deazaguanine synthase QueC [Heliorestis convoluta]|uniref:7-cyano-7-deazaguanine synthase n=1 Tax=Heliorestis convoluta TaxID=356322 RepID=A0A5Q2N623_9FIRM|nr:7-cyano-7-deazaguanine synthase QueC [Heliorestis convoluta]QGG49393.1 7-cyano-7-deazaguanine synthase QueC [Heliorestis convoluta]